MSLLIFLGVLSVLILVHEFGHFFTAKKLGVRVERFSLGFGPALIKRRIRGTEYCLSALPLGGYVKMAGDSAEDRKGARDEFLSQSPGRRFWIIFCGPVLNYLLGFFFFWFIFFTGFPSLSTTVGSVMDGYGAQAAGIRAGDVITSIDGRKVASWQQLQRIVQSRKDSPVLKVTVNRGGSDMPFDVSLRTESIADGAGGKKAVGRLGVTASFEHLSTERHGFIASCSLAGQETWNLTVLTYQGLWRMVSGRLSMKESITGPLGIFMITSEAAHVGFSALVQLMAVLSISLALFNLLPLPILDGGHLALLGIEKMRGKALSARIEDAITRVGMTFIILLAVLVTYNDIVRLFGARIGKLFN